MELAVARSRALGRSYLHSAMGVRAVGAAERWLAVHAVRAGLADVVSAHGLVDASAQMGAIGALLGALAGSIASTELAVLAGIAGAGTGATACLRGIRRLEQAREAALDRSLSEMLEVMALGLRSGLSFDRSFALYADSFASTLAQECGAAQRRWQLGLSSREDALRSLADSYASPLLRRVVEGMVRSLRFGSGLADLLESSATEARAERRARIEERVAKAPVKMMVPTGTLILPAMLLLVLGPVLLELVEGF